MEPVAIIGIGCRFPRAKDPEAFWRLLREGKNQRQIAQELGKHPQSVSQAVKRGNIAAITQAEEVTREILRIIDKSKTVYITGVNHK